jgi:acetyl esterase/lipase
MFTSFVAVAALALTGTFATMAVPSSGEIFSRLVAERGAVVQRDQSFGPNTRHRLDVYRPKTPCPDGPVVIFWYGGGWTSGDRATYGFVGSALAGRGITTVVPDYRHYPEVTFPGFVDDAALAYAWVAKNVAMNGAKPRPIIVMGHSAGAHTAALLAYDQGYLMRAGSNLPKPTGLIGLAGPYSFDPTTWPTTKQIFATAPSADSARPVSFIRPGAPPALLLHGAADTTVRRPQSRRHAR